MSKIRMLFYGDAPTVATGFGSVTRGILTNLHKTGRYDIKVMGINYWGDPHEFPFPIWPIGIGGKDPYGRQRSAEMMMAEDLQFDVLFMIQDSFIMEYMTQVFPKLRAAKKFTSVCYFPVDGVPKPMWMKAMGMFDHPVAYTNFGKKEAILANPSLAERTGVIYHGVNTSDFYPLPKDEVENFRRQYFAHHAGKYIISNINRNQQRKDIPRTIAVFKEFKQRRPNSVLYLHMAHKDQGWNMPEVVQSYGLRLGEDVLLPGGDFSPNRGYPLEIVNLIYNASDVIVSTTLGEGWGLSSTEALAARRPIIFPDNTSLPEIIGEDRGYLVPSGEDSTVLPNDNEVIRPLTSVPGFVEKLLRAHDNREEAAKFAENGFNWVKNNLTWDKHITPQWDKLFQKAVLEMVKSSSKPGVISAEDL